MDHPSAGRCCALVPIDRNERNHKSRASTSLESGRREDRAAWINGYTRVMKSDIKADPGSPSSRKGEGRQRELERRG